MDLSRYELLWPADLFTAEAERVARSDRRGWSSRAEWLLTEAFSGSTAASDFEELPTSAPGRQADPWATSLVATPDAIVVTKGMWFNELISRAGELRLWTEPRPYWTQRRRPATPVREPDAAAVRRDFARLIGDLERHGYLEEIFGKDCPDDHDELPDPSEELDKRLGLSGLWPPRPQEWDEDTFFGLVEVFHDLVSRPRNRWPHPWSGCGWHHNEFNTAPARVLYRWRINQLLSAAGIDYRLADDGEDQGRLVSVTDEARSDLVHQTLQTADQDVRQRIDHGVALFRSRGASVENKRSAILALVGILEERRHLIRTEIGRPDEGDLFKIANGYSLRHRRAGERNDYDPAFMDWIFWWYLATVELTTRILERQARDASI
jgi:hypothetical protein